MNCQYKYLCRIPVLNISFPAAKSWRIHSKGNCLKASPFRSFHELHNNIPIFIHLKFIIKTKVPGCVQDKNLI